MANGPGKSHRKHPRVQAREDAVSVPGLREVLQREDRDGHGWIAASDSFHRLSPKHLQRYVNEFAGRYNLRERDTIDIMARIAALMIGKRLMYRDLVADNGRSPVAG